MINIFEELAIKNPEVHFLKAQLVSRIAQEIKQRRLTQQAAAKIMGIRQPKLCTLLKGHFDNCSIDRLVRYLLRFNLTCELVIENRVKSQLG